jgi:hypothetical protein
MHCVTDGRMKQDQAKALERDASLRSLAELANPFVDGDGDRIGQVEAACLGDAKRATHERRGGMDHNCPVKSRIMATGYNEGYCQFRCFDPKVP